MVSNLTIDKKGYEDNWDDLKMIRSEVRVIKEELLQLIEEDSKSYQAVMEAYQLPKTTEQEKQARTAAIQQAIYLAAVVPLNIARKCLEGFQFVKPALIKGNRNAWSDAKVGAVMLRSAIYGAIFNVKINLESLKDQSLVTSLQNEIGDILSRADKLEQDALS
jgi:formiminotetrahydrofolate cyclodeaminase